MSDDPHAPNPPRPDPGDTLRRDSRRRERREVGQRSFWDSLRVLGMVGWPISLASVGGAWAGRMLDRRFQTGIHLTLIGLFLGVVVGSFAAWRSVRPHTHDRP